MISLQGQEDVSREDEPLKAPKEKGIGAEMRTAGLSLPVLNSVFLTPLSSLKERF